MTGKTARLFHFGDNLTLSEYSPIDASLDTFALSRQAMRCSPKTLEFYKDTAGAFVRWLKARGIRDARDITANHVRAYLVELQERGLKDTSQHCHARAIKAWLRWLHAEGETEGDVMARVKMPRLDKRAPDVFTADEVKALLAACDRESVQGLRDYAVIMCLLDSGLRRSELCALRLADVDMRSGIVQVRQGKGGKDRQTRFGAKARAALLRYVARCGDLAADAPVFGLSGRALATRLWRLGKRAGVMPCGAHRFRRTFATWMLRDGCDLETLRLLMGHSGLAVLLRYLALGVADVARTHEAHSPADHMLN